VVEPDVGGLFPDVVELQVEAPLPEGELHLAPLDDKGVDQARLRLDGVHLAADELPAFGLLVEKL